MIQTPTTPGDYPIPLPAGQPPMLRHWNGKVWSAPFYADDESQVAQRARKTPMRTEPAWLTRELSDATR